jgi:hypothetical protein
MSTASTTALTVTIHTVRRCSYGSQSSRINMRLRQACHQREDQSIVVEASNHEELDIHRT